MILFILFFTVFSLTLGNILGQDVGVEEGVFPVAVDLQSGSRLLDVLRHAEEGELLVRQPRRQSHHLDRKKPMLQGGSV